MPQVKLQRYKISLIRESNGEWSVSGYWEIDTPRSDNIYKRTWDLDGASQTFKTRKEALESCMNVTGIPE